MKNKINVTKDFENGNNSSKSGMTIVEVLIFITILSVVLVSLIAVTTSIIRQSKTNYNKTYATHYAEELSEWLRVQRDVVGWNSFYAKAMTAPRTFCMNTAVALNTAFSALITGACPYTGIVGQNPAIFSRTVVFSQPPTPVPSVQNSVNAKITVSWQEPGGAVFSSEVSTVYAPQ